MNPPMNPPAPLQTLTSELASSLKERTQTTLSAIISRNKNTKYFRESPLLSSFCDALSKSHSSDQTVVLDTFYKLVPLSTYATYQPFVSRFFTSSSTNHLNTTSNAISSTNIADLLSPGLPEFIAHSSGTTGGALKHFPKYKHEQYKPTTQISASQLTMTICGINSLRLSKVLDVVEDQDDGSRIMIKRIPICLMSSGGMREYLGITVDDDDALMPKRVPASNTSPYAVSFISSYPLCYLMHGLFAIADPSLVFMSITFSPLLYDFIKLLEENWETLVQAIEDGQLPDAAFTHLGDLGELRPHLQAALKPNPSRAADLRKIEKSTAGWLKKVWPHLAMIRATCSGQYAAIVPKIRHHLGPSVLLQSFVYGATECTVGYGYDGLDFNLFKIEKWEYFEYLPITPEKCEKDGSVEELKQAWELEPGKHYELVATTQDGLWRYQLGDILLLIGFDPEDGQPIVRYSERRHMGLRIAGEYITEKELSSAIYSPEVKDALGCSVVGFTLAVDERKTPRAHGFFVELDGEPGSNAHNALTHLYTLLAAGNEAYARFINTQFIGPPTIRLLRPGTFREYRQWKIGRIGGGGSVMGQVKVPSVVLDAETVDWLEERVSGEVNRLQL